MTQNNNSTELTADDFNWGVDSSEESFDSNRRVFSIVKDSEYYPNLIVNGVAPQYYYEKKYNNPYSLKIISGKKVDESTYFFTSVDATIQEYEEKLKFSQCNVIIIVPTTKQDLHLCPTIVGIANHISAKLNIPLSNALEKTIFRFGRGRSRKETHERIKDSMHVIDPNIKDKNVLLLDDVRTSGITTLECAKILKEAGAKSIVSLYLGVHTSMIPTNT